MKTSELLVEPLLIGFAVLVTAGLLGSPALLALLFGVEWSSAAGAGALAYFAGVVFDRLADTLLGSLDHHHRLQFALRALADHNPTSRSDAFPEDAYHVRLMNQESAWAHVSYLRSRIRLIRALLVLTPALGVGVAVHTVGAGTTTRFVAVSFVLWIYLLVGGLASRRRHRVTAARLATSDAESYDPPRTDGLSDRRVRDWYTERFDTDLPLMSFVVQYEPASRGALVLAILAGAVALSRGSLVLGLSLTASTIVLMAVLTFCWWRITETFFTFLQNYARFTPPAANVTSHFPGV